MAKLLVFSFDSLVDLSEVRRESFVASFNAELKGSTPPVSLADYSPLSSMKLEGALEPMANYRRVHPSAEFDEAAVNARVAAAVAEGAGKGVFAPAAREALAWAKAAGIKTALVSTVPGGVGSVERALKCDPSTLFDTVEAVPAMTVEVVKRIVGSATGGATTVVIAPAPLASVTSLGGELASLGIACIPTLDPLDTTPAFLKRAVLPRGSVPPLIPRLRIVIPMAGLGSRFEKDGFSIQKPFLPTLEGVQLWSSVVENLMPKEEPLRSATEVHVVVRADQVANFAAPPHVTMHTVAALTEGPACTVMSLEHIINDDCPLMIGNSDQFLEWDADAFYESAFHPDFDGAISTFYHPRPDDLKWSYASMDATTGAVGTVAEKVYVGPYATTGLYAWKKGSQFVGAAKAMIAANIRVNNEFYVCPVYNTAMEGGLRYRTINCARFWGVGIPDDYNAWLDGYVPPGPPPPFREALARKYAAMWCKWGSRVPVPQPTVASDPALCACMWSTGAFHTTPALAALKAALAPWSGKFQWYDPSPGLGLGPQGKGSTSAGNAPVSYAAAAARPPAVLHHTFFQFNTFPVPPTAATTLPLQAWAAAAQGAMAELPPYYLTLTGVAPVRSGIVACGYPPCDYLPVRTAIRGAGPCKEPHAQDIHHVTLLRWTAPLTPGENNAVRAVLAQFRGADLGMFQPTAWNVGLATWSVRPESVTPVVTWRAPPAPWVLHRGNTQGLSPATENDPARLKALLAQGWDVEIDLWRCTGREAVSLAEAAGAAGHASAGAGVLAGLKSHVESQGKGGRMCLWLGHDAPTWPLEREEEGEGGLLSTPGVWIHCKHPPAFFHLRTHPRSTSFNFFSHDKDEFALTSKGAVWAYPGLPIPGPGTISVVWPKDKVAKGVLPGVGVCWDYLPKDVKVEFA